MLYQPTFLEALLALKPEIEKKARKGYTLSKTLLKERLKLYSTYEEKVGIIEDILNEINNRLDDDERLKFMLEIFDTPNSNMKDMVYDSEGEPDRDLNLLDEEKCKKYYQTYTIHSDTVPYNYKEIDSDFKCNFTLLAYKAYQIKMPEGFFKAAAEIKYFRLYLSFITRKLTLFKEKLSIENKNKQVDSVILPKPDRKEYKTILTNNQTGLFAYYMREAKIFLNSPPLSNENLGKAFQILTHYSFNNLRLFNADKKRNSPKEDFEVLKKTLVEVIEKIDKDIKKINRN